MLNKGEAPSPSRLRAGLLVLLLVSSGLALPMLAFGSATGTPAAGQAKAIPPVKVAPFAAESGGPGAGLYVRNETGHFVSADGVATVSQIEIMVVAPKNGTIDSLVLKGQLPLSTVKCGSGVYVVTGVNGDGRTARAVGLLGGGPGFQIQGVSSGPGPGESVPGPQPYSPTAGLTAAIPNPWSELSQRRSKFEIYVRILELMGRGPMTPFEVSFYGRLNHKRTKEYIEYLEQKGFLQLVTEDGKASYVLTRDGAGFLEKWGALFMGTRLVEVPAYQYARDF